uniref:Uncharacterized protein n=1 Tax=Rousettus aegyptiacus TaxID=9407 RepID=A0A7J8IM30_ROUAE|nr:hypothetical protein HJG63_010575 [Rousettus aegyptiacus]
MLGIFSYVCWPSVCILWKNVFSCSLTLRAISLHKLIRSCLVSGPPVSSQRFLPCPSYPQQHLRVAPPLYSPWLLSPVWPSDALLPTIAPSLSGNIPPSPAMSSHFVLATEYLTPDCRVGWIRGKKSKWRKRVARPE